jgi:predicted lipoprotein with Yx(FWY)xxD motif
MTTRKIPGRGSGDRPQRVSSGPARLPMLLVLPAAAAAAAALAACGSSGTPSTASASGGSSAHVAAAAVGLKTAKIGGATVLTNVKGFAVYSFAPDTMTRSDCTGACAAAWPPVKGPATAGVGLTGKLGTIKRPDGSTQATYNGHPLYTFIKDTGPGTDKGNGVNAFGGLWHALTASGSAVPASISSGSSSHHHHSPATHAAVTTPPAPPATAPAQPANPIPQGNGGDHDADNTGGPSDGDGNI